MSTPKKKSQSEYILLHVSSNNTFARFLNHFTLSLSLPFYTHTNFILKFLTKNGTVKLQLCSIKHYTKERERERVCVSVGLKTQSSSH